MNSRLLVVLSGPIASGKSSAAHALAAGFRAKGRRAAAIDLDLLYKVLDHGQPMGNPTSWRQARRTATALADEFVLAGFEMVVVEGTFWTKAARDEIELVALPSTGNPASFALPGTLARPCST